MIEQVRFLPWSGRRYQVTNLGEIATSDGKLVISKLIDGEHHVELEWVLGKRLYNQAVLVMLAFDILGVPDHILDDVKPLYVDGNSSNLIPVNLTYRFINGPSEVEGHPGYFRIPFYANYAISRQGRLINIVTGKEKTWSITLGNQLRGAVGGYLYSRVVSDLGFSRTLFQHRAMCLVFKEYGSNVGDLHVNHLDGQPGNNQLSNLEWVTPLENIMHAVETGLRGDNKPILTRNVLTGEVLRFSSINACGRHYGQPRAGFVSHRLKNSPNKIYSDMLQIKYDDGEPWPELSEEQLKVVRVGRANDIAARNVFTGEVIVLGGASEMSNYTGVKVGTIHVHVRENRAIPISGWNFRWYGRDLAWPDHSPKHLKIYAKHPVYPGDGVDAVNLETREEKFFESVAIACDELKITKTVCYRAMSSGAPISGKWKLSLFRLRENLSPPAE